MNTACSDAFIKNKKKEGKRLWAHRELMGGCRFSHLCPLLCGSALLHTPPVGTNSAAPSPDPGAPCPSWGPGMGLAPGALGFEGLGSPRGAAALPSPEGNYPASWPGPACRKHQGKPPVLPKLDVPAQGRTSKSPEEQGQTLGTEGAAPG